MTAIEKCALSFGVVNIGCFHIRRRTNHQTISSSSVKARRTSHLDLAVLNLYEDGQTKDFKCDRGLEPVLAAPALQAFVVVLITHKITLPLLVWDSHSPLRSKYDHLFI